MWENYYDFRSQYIDWTSFWPGAILIVITSVWLWMRIRSGKCASLVLLALLAEVLLFLFLTWSAYDQIRYYRDRFDKKLYSTVEGVITEHDPVLYGDGGLESFIVNGVKFEFLGKDSPPPFHRTVAQGGLIRNGLYVKITYTDRYGSVPRWAILRIEVRR